MDHRSFLRSLSPEVQARLTRKSNGPGLCRLAAHLGLALLGGCWIALGWPLWWAILLPHGIVLTFLFTLEHEATHQTPFANKGLNEWIGRFVGLVIFLPFTWFRYFHLAHHKHTNIPGKDPELGGLKPDTPGRMALYITGYGYWRGVATVLWRGAFGDPTEPWLPRSALPRVRLEMRLMILIYAVAFGLVGSTLLWLWLLPLLLGQPFLRLYLMAEHGRCPQVADMFDNTRTTFTNRLVRLLAWNMPYHTEHHTFPAVPFHQLPALHHLMRPHLRHRAESYTANTQAHASAILRAKVPPA